MKKKIQIGYEVTARVTVEVEVEEEDFDRLMKTADLNELEKYDIRDDILYKQAVEDGWTESDWCVTDEKGEVLIPWGNQFPWWNQ